MLNILLSAGYRTGQLTKRFLRILRTAFLTKLSRQTRLEPHRCSKAVIYAVTKDSLYFDQARDSISSLRKSGYRDKIIVITDMPELFRELSRSENLAIERIPALETAPGEYNFFSRNAKLSVNQSARAEMNLFLDADTLIRHPIDKIWNYLERADLAFALEPVYKTPKIASVWHCQFCRSEAESQLVSHYKFRGLRYFNSGVFLWRTSDKVDVFFEEWRSEWRRFQKVDQPSLNRVLSRLDLRVATLAPKFNHSPATNKREPTFIEHYWTSLDKISP